MNILILPDLLLLLLGLVVLATDLLQNQSGSDLTFHLSWAGLTLILLILFLAPSGESYLFFNSYLITGIGLLFRQIFIISALFTVFLSRSYFIEGGNIKEPLPYRGEFHLIILITTLGMFTVVSATDLLTLFIGVELATIPLYALCAFRKGDGRSAEAATKYIIMGSLATAFMLYGYSLLYGCTGSLEFEAILSYASQNQDSPLLNLAVLFILAASCFKLTIFPFHMWAPDVYEGAPTPVTAFISVSSKATGIAFLVILLYGPLAPLHNQLQYLILLLAGATMTVGNLGALKQQNLLRFMAYSSIAQAGYILMAMAGNQVMGQTAIIYYLLVYAAANYAMFFIISIIGEKRQEVFVSLQGLAKQNPALAGVLVLTMFSLGSIPPLAGFVGKFMLFAAAAEQGFYFMVIFAALNSTVSLYYYLLVLKEAYIVQPVTEPAPLRIDPVQKVSLVTLTLAMILLGLLPVVSNRIMQIIN